MSKIVATPQSALRQSRSLSQTQFSTERDLVLPISIYNSPCFHKIIQYLLAFSSSSSRPSNFPSITCFRRQLLHKMWPIQFAFRLCTWCRIFLCSLTLCQTSLLTRSVQMIAIQLSTASQKLPGISDLLSAVSKFRRHTKLCFKYSTLVVSFLNLSPICWWRDSSC